MQVPPEAFDEIIQELQRQPLPMNEYRISSGSGRSQVFGVVGRRCLPPDYSRLCWTRPYLYKLLLDFGKQHVPIPWNAITCNQSYKADKHYDKNNVGDSFLVSFGKYTGGDLLIHEGDLSGNHNICYKPIVTDFSKVLHSVEEFEGERYSLVYYYYKNNRSVELPLPSVKEEEGKYYFYRGTSKITKEEGLPHPLRGRKKEQRTNIKTLRGNFKVDFE
jgi:hypothetical protein